MSLKKYKPYLKYHRIFALIIVFTMIWLTYRFQHAPDVYPNGQAKSYGRRENGQNQGEWFWYYESGKTKMKGKFQQGKREGIWYLYREDGSLLSESTYAEDLMNGEQKIFDEKGKLYKILHFRNDQLISP